MVLKRLSNLVSSYYLCQICLICTRKLFAISFVNQVSHCIIYLMLMSIYLAITKFCIKIPNAFLLCIIMTQSQRNIFISLIAIWHIEVPQQRGGVLSSLLGRGIINHFSPSLHTTSLISFSEFLGMQVHTWNPLGSAPASREASLLETTVICRP